jgi:hypothetical protein
MIRQAHAYLAGAVSGTALIAAAVVVFVLLVSAQAFRDWPIPGLGGSNDRASITTGSSAKGAGAPTASSTSTGAAAAKGGVVGGGSGSTSPTGLAAQQDGARGGNSGSANSPAASGTNQGSGSATGGGGNSGSPSNGNGNGTGSSPSATITGTVNDTVDQVDDSVLGGALQDTGVTHVTQGVVNGVAGPDSTVGQTVDKAAGAVGGLLGDHH